MNLILFDVCDINRGDEFAISFI